MPERAELPAKWTHEILQAAIGNYINSLWIPRHLPSAKLFYSG